MSFTTFKRPAPVRKDRSDEFSSFIAKPRAAVMPCPFCGHVGLDFAEGSTFRWLAYACGGCGMGSETRVQTMGAGTNEEWAAQARADAVAEWNRRAALAAPPEPQPARRCKNCDDTGDVNSVTGEWRGYCHCAAGQALRAAPIEPEAAQPVTWQMPEWAKRDDLGGLVPSDIRVALHQAFDAGRASHPPVPKRQPLTGDEINDLWATASDHDDGVNIHTLARAIEAAHGIGAKP